MSKIQSDTEHLILNADGSGKEVRFQNNGTQNVVIDSSGNVGIGTASPANTLDVDSTSSTVAKFQRDSSANGSLTIGFPSQRTTLTSAQQFIFINNGAERMRIDSSGNLLVGKTSSALNTVGVELQSNRIYATRDGGQAIAVNRKTSDGEIVTFHKDGNEVGRIGINTDRLFIGDSSYGGIAFPSGGQGILPAGGAGVLNDNSADIGNASYRWKDLYLSGGVYVGGTGSANYLDDYEEGTWTPSLDFRSGATGSLNYTRNNGRYIKIGSMVFISAYIQWNQNNISASSNVLQLEGLPFTAANTADYRGGISVTYSSNPWTGVTIYQQAFRVESNETNMIFNFSDSTDGSMDANISSYNKINGVGNIMISGVYSII